MARPPTDPGDDQPFDEAQENDPGQKPDVAKAVEAAASSAMGTTSGSRLGTKTVAIMRNAAKRENRDYTMLVVVVLGTLLCIGIVAVVVLAKRKNVNPAAAVYQPTFDTGMSGSEEVRSLAAVAGKDLTEVQRSTKELSQTVSSLSTRMEKMERNQEAFLERVTKTFETASQVQQQRLVEQAPKQAAIDPAKQGAIDATLEKFRAQLSGMIIPPAKAQEFLIDQLRKLGLSEQQIKDLMSQEATKAGRIAVGNVAEPILTKDEIVKSTVPDWVKANIEAVRDLIYGLSITDGRLYPEQFYGDIRSFLMTKDPAKARELTDTVIRETGRIARIRRENLKPAQENLLPLLVIRRNEAGIPTIERFKIAALVWSMRTHLEGDDEPNPGQLLTMAETVAGAIEPVGSGPRSSKRDPLTPSDIPVAAEFLAAAVAQAQALGKDQAGQYHQADVALTGWLETNRKNATDQQRQAVILRALASRTGPASEPAAAVASASAVVAATSSTSAEGLYFGPLRADPRASVRILTFAVAGAVTSTHRERLDERTSAAALIAAIEQCRRVAAMHLPARVGQPGGGKLFLEQGVGDLLPMARMGEALGQIDVPLARDPAVEIAHPRATAAIKGALIGVAYGPGIHDEATAKAQALQVINQANEQRPLTEAVAQRLDAIEDPLERILTAYDVLRPGRLAYPADRFAQVVRSMADMERTSTLLSERLAPRLNDEGVLLKQDLRLLIPFSVGIHDDLKVPVPITMASTEQDLVRYSSQHLAEQTVGQRVVTSLIPRYAASALGDQASVVNVLEAVSDFTAHEISERFIGKNVNPSDIETMADETSGAVIPMAEAEVVRAVVFERVRPRIESLGNGFSEPQIEQARQAASNAIRQGVSEPYSPVRMDTWATAATEAARRVFQQRGGTTSDPLATNVRSSQGRPGGGVSLMPPITMMSVAASSLPGIGSSIERLTQRKLVIPAASYGNAHILNGVDAEIGGRGNLPVMLRVQLSLSTPGGKRIVIPDARFTGTTTPMAGPQRVAIDLKQMSFVTPMGRTVRSEVNGYVADNISGMYGALGEYKWNAEKVLPLALIAGGGEGAADALASNSQTTVVTGLNQATVNTASQAQTALFGGLSGAAGIMTDYVKSVLSEVHPSVEMKNGQRVSLVILEEVPFDMPVEEYEAMIHGDGNGF